MLRVLSLCLLLLPACATSSPALAPEADPSNPRAAEAPLPAEPTTLRPVAPDAGPAPAPAAEGQAQGWTCPMHPEVDLPGPGRCPHCGMKLVPREAAQGGGHE